MKWKLTYVMVPDGVRPLQTLPTQTKQLSSFAKVQEWIKTNLRAEGQVWEKVSKRPRSQRRAAAKAPIDATRFQLFCSFHRGYMS